MTHLHHTAIPPAKLLDHELEAHIRRLFLTISSIMEEIRFCWARPDSRQAMAILRKQVGETTSALDAALYVYDERLISMR